MEGRFLSMILVPNRDAIAEERKREEQEARAEAAREEEQKSEAARETEAKADAPAGPEGI
jgi:hypothetical protein